MIYILGLYLITKFAKLLYKNIIFNQSLKNLLVFLKKFNFIKKKFFFIIFIYYFLLKNQFIRLNFAIIRNYFSIFFCFFFL